MMQHVRTQLDALRIGVRQRDLRSREQDALVCLGKVTLGDGGSRVGRLAALAVEAATARRNLDAATAARRASSGAPRADLQRRIEAIEQKLYELHLTAGRLAAAMELPTAAGGSDVEAIRTELASAASERARLHAEGRRAGEEFRVRFRAWLTSRAPELTGLVLGWWIAAGYTASHIGPIFKALGLSQRRSGHHLVSLSTDTMLVQYGLPLLAAAAGAWLGHLLSPWVWRAVDVYQSRGGRVAD